MTRKPKPQILDPADAVPVPRPPKQPTKEEKEAAEHAAHMAALRARRQARRFDLTRPPPEPVAIFSLAGKTICTTGNLSTILAKAKSGKTALVGAFIGAVIAADLGHEDVDTLHVTAAAPCGAVVLHFDTEQSPYDQHRSVWRSHQRAGATVQPSWLWSYTLAGWSANDLRAALADALAEVRALGLKVYAVILDGVADLCNNPNDLEEGNGLVAELHNNAIEYDTHLVCIMHQNEGEAADKTGRGHLGKQLMRKAESNLQLEKVEGVTEVTAPCNRGAPILPSDRVQFSYDEAAKMHRIVHVEPTDDKAAKKAENAAKKAARTRAVAEAVFSGKSVMTYTDVVNGIRRVRAKGDKLLGETQAQDDVGFMVESQILAKNSSGEYTLTPSTPEPRTTPE